MDRHERPATLSIRLSWPFLRLVEGDPAKIAPLTRGTLGAGDFADPDARMRHSTVMELLDVAVQRSGDPAIGLRAGENFEPNDLGVLEHAVRTAANLGEAMRCGVRFMPLINEAACASIDVDAERVYWRWRAVDGVPQLPASNDFVLASALCGWRRGTNVNIAPLEVHVMHDAPTSAAEYARVFGCEVRYGMPCNAIVMSRALLELPMIHANRGLYVAFERHAASLLERLRTEQSVSARARAVVRAEIPEGDASMERVARKLAMSVATLRRRLEEENTSHREIVDSVRCELAHFYLLERDMPIGEVAYLLGFAHVTAFYKAFKRWNRGLTPAEFRARGTSRAVAA